MLAAPFAVNRKIVPTNMLCVGVVFSQNPPFCYWSFEGSKGGIMIPEDNGTDHGLVAVEGADSLALRPAVIGKGLHFLGTTSELLVAESRNEFNFSEFSIEATVFYIPDGWRQKVWV